MHFLRMQGGNGEKDPRSHKYLDQLGYWGIASWSYSGSNADISAIKKHLRPASFPIGRRRGAFVRAKRE